jgi:hypothetical protein
MVVCNRLQYPDRVFYVCTFDPALPGSETLHTPHRLFAALPGETQKLIMERITAKNIFVDANGNPRDFRSFFIMPKYDACIYCTLHRRKGRDCSCPTEEPCMQCSKNTMPCIIPLRTDDGFGMLLLPLAKSMRAGKSWHEAGYYLV